MAIAVIDPICGMEIDPATAVGSSQYKSRTYYFCAPGSKTSFDRDPEKYLSRSENESH